jgi:hypothetical protein
MCLRNGTIKLKSQWVYPSFYSTIRVKRGKFGPWAVRKLLKITQKTKELLGVGAIHAVFLADAS